MGASEGSSINRARRGAVLVHRAGAPARAGARALPRGDRGARAGRPGRDRARRPDAARRSRRRARAAPRVLVGAVQRGRRLPRDDARLPREARPGDVARVPRRPRAAGLGTLGGAVLRYMPLRRCTAIDDDAVAKVKRPHRAATAWALLGAVHRALGDGLAGFEVPAPIAYDEDRARYSQRVVAGGDLATVLDEDRIRRVGALHRAMHAADVQGVPAEDPAEALAELRADARWVAFALPEHADTVREVRAALETHAPGAPAEPAFCHGDLTPSQMLVDGDRWAITDFDGARIGDPHRDLAIWLASLPLEAPALPPGAEAAYLDGYGAQDERRLRWHRAAAEVHYAAVALKKDRHPPARTERALGLARACAEDL